jgi:hypothetical protein
MVSVLTPISAPTVASGFAGLVRGDGLVQSLSLQHPVSAGHALPLEGSGHVVAVNVEPMSDLIEGGTALVGLH